MTAYHIQLSETARDHIKRLLAKEAGTGFRVSIKKTGCSGYSYVPSIVTKPAPQDAVIDNIADFPVYIDSHFSDLLQELNIDLIEDNNMGLKQKKLVFNNPNESGRCGCGESFHVRGDE